jgi:pyruvate dehydrogenase E2 component (dihydrolipoamide acetyltransferase)
MAELINMPKLGFDMREGQLVSWLKKPGDPVAAGDVIAEIESDKATVEVEAYVAGTLLEVLVKEGDWVPIGAPIAIVGQAGEKVDLAALGVTAAAAETAATAAPTPVTAAAPAPAVGAPPPSNGDGAGLPAGVRASPLARRLAEDLGIDLRSVAGSGPQGRITKADVQAYEKTASAAPVMAAPPAAVPAAYIPAQAASGDEVIQTPRMRARIGERMVQAKQQVPHFYVTTSIDMGPALDLRKEINTRLEAQGIKISVNDLVIKAAALALRAYPNINASFNGDTIVRHRRINIGIAVAVENGLINVVSQDADQATLTALAGRHKDMIDRARQGKVRPEDVEGETFAVSNLGPWDVDHFIAIINPPAAAILALGTAQRVPVVLDDGRLDVGWRMKATLSADHRVTDGAEAASFMQHFKQLLEDPIRLLV